MSKDIPVRTCVPGLVQHLAPQELGLPDARQSPSLAPSPCPPWYLPMHSVFESGLQGRIITLLSLHCGWQGRQGITELFSSE